MTLEGFQRSIEPLELLSDEMIHKIHKKTLEVLEETGLSISHEKSLEFLSEKGCDVDFDKNRVRFPPSLVEECLDKCPSSYSIKSRSENYNLDIKQDKLFFGTYPGEKIVDTDTWERRTPTKEENYSAVKVLDALDHLHLTNCYSPYFGFEGVPAPMSIPESIASRLRLSPKIHTNGYRNNSEKFTIEMAKVAGTENIGIMTTSSPLSIDEDSARACFRFCKADFPYAIASGPTLGATAPVTISGGIIITNAEIMSGIVLAQLINPGTRILVSDTAFPQNMRSGAPSFGAMGAGLHYVLFNQIWRHYDIPRACSAPGASNSKKIDIQCGYERAINALVGAVSGANVLFLFGGVHGELSFHPLQAIIDDDIAGMIGRFVEGVEVSEESLAVDLIKEVGPIPGTYLNKKHTREWWKKEQFIPKAADRLTYPEWLEKEKKSAIELAKDRMNTILDAHKPKKLSPEKDEKIEKILEETRQYYKENDLL